MKNKYTSVFLSVVLLLVVLCGCSQKDSGPEYTYGRLDEGQSISELYDLVGKSQVKVYSISGKLDSCVIHTQQTADSGWVAWTTGWVKNYYVYTDADVGVYEIDRELAFHIAG